MPDSGGKDLSHIYEYISERRHVVGVGRQGLGSQAVRFLNVTNTERIYIGDLFHSGTVSVTISEGAWPAEGEEVPLSRVYARIPVFKKQCFY